MSNRINFISFNINPDQVLSNCKTINWLPSVQPSDFPLTMLVSEKGPWKIKVKNVNFCIYKKTYTNHIKIKAVIDLQSNVKEVVNLRETLKSAKIAYWDYNPLTNAVDFDPSWFNDIDVVSDSSKLNSWMETLHPEDLEIVQNKISDHINGKTPRYEVLMRLRAKDGKFRFVFSRGKIVERNEENIATKFIGTHVDLTELFELKEQLIQSTMKNSMAKIAASLAHEINTPLASILASSLMIKNSQPSLVKFTDKLDLAVNNISQMLDKFDYFLADPESKTTVSSITDILKTSLDVVSNKEKEIHISDCSVKVVANKEDLVKAFGNIITNAIEEPTCKNIRISHSIFDDYLCIKISNDGDKIENKTSAVMFEPFFSTKKTPHCGLGLSIAKNIIESHGGTISLDLTSNENNFIIKLPFIKEVQ